jgi:hypothetical protein
MSAATADFGQPNPLSPVKRTKDRSPFSPSLVQHYNLPRYLYYCYHGEARPNPRFRLVRQGLQAVLQGKVPLHRSTRQWRLRKVSGFAATSRLECRIDHPRCIRLKKQCQPPDSSRMRGLGNPDSGAPIAKLERRIEALTTTLQSVANAMGVCSDSPSLTEAALQSSLSRTSNSAQSPPLPPPLYELALNEAAWYLDRFMNHMLPCFPFIYISPGTTVQQLRRDRPFLTGAIIAVATPSTQEKLDRAERLKCHLTRLTVLENQSNIDMLLGILTYIAWSTDPFLQRASNLSRMIMLAMSLVYDLQLGKKQPPEAHVIASMTPGLWNPERNTGDSSDQGILEQQRAVLACFVLSSMYVFSPCIVLLYVFSH